MLTTKALRRAFPDWLRIRGDLDVLEHLVADKKRKQVKRPIRANKSWDWVYCFVLPGDAD